MIDFVDSRTLGGLELEPQFDEGWEVDIELAGSGIRKEVPIHVEGKVPLLENLTKDFAQELDEVPVVSIVRLPAIKSNVVELDPRKGLLRPLGAVSDEARSQEIDYEAKPYGIVLKGIGPTQAPVKALMIMRSENSILDLPLDGPVRAATGGRGDWGIENRNCHSKTPAPGG